MSLLKKTVSVIASIGILSAGYNQYVERHFSLSKDIKTNILVVKEAAQHVFGTTNKYVTLLAATQGIHESGLHIGQPSTLALKGNNLFGVKYNPKVNKYYIELDTIECKGKKCFKVKAKFAKYGSILESFQALKVLYSKPNYKKVWESKSCEEAAISIAKGGYATDPKYSQKLIIICGKLEKGLL